MKPPKVYAKDDVGMYQMRCKDCGKFFKARDEATCLRFLKLHVKKSHPDGVSIKLPSLTEREKDKLFCQTNGMNISQVKLVSK
jgi:hypothetical protein